MRKKFTLDIEALKKELDLYDNPETEKQKHILEAAEALFGDKGFDATPTAEIARKAGVTERTLFKHFKTKGDLLKRVVFSLALKTLLPVQLQRVKALAQANYPTYREFLLAIARDRLEVLSKHGPRAKIVFMELLQNERFLDQLKPLWREHVWEEIVKAMKRLQEEGSVRKDMRPETIARASVLTVMSYIFLRKFISPKEKWDDEKEISDLVKILFEGVGAK